MKWFSHIGMRNIKVLGVKARSSRPEVFYKKGVLGNLVKFTGK